MPALRPMRATAQITLLRWYRKHGRDLPWRRTRDPYRILVSELMLQQTQVVRVLPKYRQFLRFFPSIKALSRATPGTVIRRWQGLGYNRRALWLHRIARIIMNDHNGRFPRDYDTLRSLPGIGDYTARALRVFAFGAQEPVIDVNVRRVLARTMRMSPLSVSADIARDILPRGKAYEWHQALMDVGSMFCTARDPECASCPLSRGCLSSGKVRPQPSAAARKEPSRHGIPRRIYRGRVLKALTDRSPMSGAHLSRVIGLRSSDADIRWLRDLVRRMHDEGLLRVRDSQKIWRVMRIT